MNFASVMPVVAAAVGAPVLAQSDPRAGHAMPPSEAAAAAHESSTEPAPDHSAMDHNALDHGAMDHGAMVHAEMPAMLGRYSATREASGTAWQPDSSPMDGVDISGRGWSAMLHGEAWAVLNHQGGPRGDTAIYPAGNVMLMASRPLGEAARFGVHAMLSGDPLMGPRGYPLLFATGETADGRTPLIDRQHPHDLLMELAITLSQEVGDRGSVYLYAGLPGEPALGPPAFMHRVSGQDDPLAPITHHWFDSTHITFGVVTGGVIVAPAKLEASGFRGREPDQHRWDFEAPRLDSWSVRGTLNPTRNLSMQASYGFLKSPEALHPQDNETRVIASVTWNLPLARGGNWATTGAWSRKSHGSENLDAWLLESDWRFGMNTLFGRFERVANAELFEHGDPLEGVWTVNQLSVGYIREWAMAPWLRFGAGAAGTLYFYPAALQPAYGANAKGGLLFVRLRLAGLSH